MEWKSNVFVKIYLRLNVYIWILAVVSYPVEIELRHALGKGEIAENENKYT